MCLIDPVGDVYACPFAIHDEFLAGNLLRDRAASRKVWRESPLFLELRRAADGRRVRVVRHYDACQGGCMAAKFFTGLPLDGPDPECVHGPRRAGPRRPRHASAAPPKPDADHSTVVRCAARRPSPVSPVDPCRCRSVAPDRGCD